MIRHLVGREVYFLVLSLGFLGAFKQILNASLVYRINHFVFKRQWHVLIQRVQIMYHEIFENQMKVLVGRYSFGFIQRGQPKLLVRVEKSKLQSDESWDRYLNFTQVDYRN